MFEIVILIFVLIAAFIGVAWYARYTSRKRAQELDLDHLEPEINLDDDFNDYFERELQQQSIGDLDSEPAVSLSSEAETILSELEPVVSLEQESTIVDTSKPVKSTVEFVIDDDELDTFDISPDYQNERNVVEADSLEDNFDDIDIVEDSEPVTAESKPTPAPNDADDLVIALTIMASDSTRFSGKAVKAGLDSLNLHFGDLQIYHRYTASSRKQSIFSVANILDPGTLLPDNFATLSTPGLLIFARLPGPVNGLAVFDDLLETAQSLTEKLGGILCDDARKPISESRLEAMRSRIFNLNFALHNENNDYSN